jgi:hypothetical protein
VSDESVFDRINREAAQARDAIKIAPAAYARISSRHPEKVMCGHNACPGEVAQLVALAPPERIREPPPPGCSRSGALCEPTTPGFRSWWSPRAATTSVMVSTTSTATPQSWPTGAWRFAEPGLKGAHQVRIIGETHLGATPRFGPGTRSSALSAAGPAT